MRRTFLATAVALSAALAAAAQPIEGIGPVGEVKQVHGDLQFTEGPTWSDKGELFFTDIPADRIYKSNGEKLDVFVEPAGHCNGLMFDAAGTLFACSMDGALVSFDSDGKKKVLADRYDGKRFNAPNDLVIDRTGGIYFTDPRFRAPEPLPQGIEAVYYWDSTTGKVLRVVEELGQKAPNGVILSPDEKTLYVVCSMQAEVVAYDIVAPGRLGEERVFASLKQAAGKSGGGGDGLTVDTKGNLYITSAIGVQVFSPDGKLLGNIELPEQPANVTFGGPDRKTLYATARTGLY
nr:SMP-30/gluconolactonase/LRE family protein [Planctomycetota bacterium]